MQVVALGAEAGQRVQLDGAPPPGPASSMPQIIGTAITFHYINRMVNVFPGETLLPLPSIMRGWT